VRDELALELLRPRADHDFRIGGERGPVAVRGEAAGARERTFAPRHRDALDLARRRRHGLVELVDAIEQVPELEPPEHLLQL